MTDTKIISIEGNIGVGKTTFTEKLKQLFSSSNTAFIQEPVDQWLKLVDNDNVNILQKFYDDKQRWGYTLQNLAYITRMTTVIEKIVPIKNKYIFTDRSIETDKNVFAKMLHDDKFLDDLEWNIYNYWNNFFDKYIKPTGKLNAIYLKCSPETAMERIKKRGRIEEANIPYEYIEKLSIYHDNWLLNTSDNVLVLDCDKDFENDLDVFNEYANKVMSFVNSL